MHYMSTILYCVKSPSPTEKSRADVCLRAHVDDEDPLTRVGLGIVGGEVVGQRRLSDTTLGRIFLLHTWWQHCDWTLQGIAKYVHRNSMSVISFSFMSYDLNFLMRWTCFSFRMFHLVVPHSVNLGLWSWTDFPPFCISIITRSLLTVLPHHLLAWQAWITVVAVVERDQVTPYWLGTSWLWPMWRPTDNWR